MAMDFAAGCIGGAAGILTGYPFDTIKVRIQTGTSGGTSSTFKCMSNIIRKEGALTLYRGMASPLAGVAAINAVGFGVYGNLLKRAEDPTSIHSVTMAGTAAGCVQAFIASPFELVKTQMQVGSGNKSTIETIRYILDQVGARGLTKGLSWTITREVPGCAVYFGSYEVMIRGREDNFPLAFFTGGLAGILSWIVTYPQDVIKSRLQADGFGPNRKWKNGYHCLVTSLRNEGYSCLWRGIGSTVIRAFPVNGATLAVVTLVKRTMSDEDSFSFFDSSCLYTSEHLYVKLPPAAHTVFGPNYQHLRNVSSLATDVAPGIIQDYGPDRNALTQARFHMESSLFSLGVPTENLVEKPILIGTMRNHFPATALLRRLSSTLAAIHGLNLRIRQSYHTLFTEEHAHCPANCHDVNLDTDSCVMLKSLSPHNLVREPSILVRERGFHIRPKQITSADFLDATDQDASSDEDRILGFYYVVNS